MTKQEVFDRIEEEMKFSNRFDCEPLRDADKPLELWLLWMEDYLAHARKAATSGFDKNLALHKLRCVLSLGVKAAMYHGLPIRAATFNEQRRLRKAND